MTNIEELKFNQEIKILFLEVIKIGLKFFENQEIKKATKNIIDEYNIFILKQDGVGDTKKLEGWDNIAKSMPEAPEVSSDEITTEDLDKAWDNQLTAI